MNSRSAAILGATSAIARDVAEILASQKNDLLLFARNLPLAEEMARDLSARHGIATRAYALNVLDFDEDIFRAELESASASLEGVILCVGYLGDNAKAANDASEAALITDTNFTGSVRVLETAAQVLARQQRGYLAALSSVAGDYPRKKVFTYGTAKAKLNTYLDGLRSRLAPEGVRVITIKLGSIDTRMAQRRNHPLVIASKSAAESIVQALHASSGVVYIPGSWKVIIKAMRFLRV